MEAADEKFAIAIAIVGHGHCWRCRHRRRRRCHCHPLEHGNLGPRGEFVSHAAATRREPLRTTCMTGRHRKADTRPVFQAVKRMISHRIPGSRLVLSCLFSCCLVLPPTRPPEPRVSSVPVLAKRIRAYLITYPSKHHGELQHGERARAGAPSLRAWPGLPRCLPQGLSLAGGRRLAARRTRWTATLRSGDPGTGDRSPRLRSRGGDSRHLA